MAAWFEDIKALTEKSGEERNAFVRRHASVRSTSVGSHHSASSDGGLEEDEADAIPFSANQSMKTQTVHDQSPVRPSRPSPGGRFPSDLMVNRNLQAPLSPSSGSSEVGNDLNTMAGGLPQEAHPTYPTQTPAYQHVEPVQPVQYAQPTPQQPQPAFVNSYQYTQQSYDPMTANGSSYVSEPQPYPTQQTRTENFDQPVGNDQPIQRHDSNNYGDWMAPAAGGAATGALAAEAYRRKQLAQQHLQAQQQSLDEHSEQHPSEQSRAMEFADATPVQEFPERHPDHIRPDQIDDAGHVAQPSAPAVQPKPDPIVAPVLDSQTHSQSNSQGTPATTSSFLGKSEVGAAPAFGQTVNGGPVPVDLVDTADSMAHPGMPKRMDTDISVSDLHVPGEYPRSSVSEATITGRVPTENTTFLNYN